MPLPTGARLGPYEVVSLLGVGGMGEVYKARDTRLGRTVALKVLPEGLAADQDRRRRFEHEARAVSALNHPHICVLHDVGSQAPSTGSGQVVDFLVMEYLEGQTLAERLARRQGVAAASPLPIEEALDIAIQIADALTAAHRAGIVHRDLKPANVMLAKAPGRGVSAKLLDFGLARLAPRHERDAEAATQSVSGMVVGTAPYMAPEQVEGRPVDGRTDLFAFGCVLYEMLTGTRAFEGTSAASVMAAVLEHEPRAASTLQPAISPAVERVITRCLAKDPEARWQSAADLAADLRWVRETRAGAAAAPGTTQSRPRRVVRLASAVAAGVALLAVGVAVAWLFRPLASSRTPAGMSLDLRPADIRPVASDWSYTPGGSHTAFAWTADGRTLVFAGYRGGSRQLFVRNVDESVARPLDGTDGAQQPAVSPDGRWVAFWAGDTIKRTPLLGGHVEVLATNIYQPTGMAWDDAGNLFLGRWEDDCIWRIDAGGMLKPVTVLGDGEVRHELPSPLPGGGALLFTVRKRDWSWGNEEVVALTLANRQRKRLLTDAANARYLATGHLVFLRRGALMAVAFDAERLEPRGTPEIVLEEPVAQALTGGNKRGVTGAGQFAIAPTGALAWIGSPLVEYPDAHLVRVDRYGRVTRLPAESRPYFEMVRVSPDRRRLLVATRTSATGGLWLYDLERATLTPVRDRMNQTGGESSNFTWWSRDGRIAFDWLADGRRSLRWAYVSGSDEPQELVPGIMWPLSATPDGRLALYRANGTAPADVALLTDENGQVRIETLIEGTETPSHADFSPDGRWLVYRSEKSGRGQIYVRPFRGPGRAEQVSVEGGTCPAWNPNGRELFFAGNRDRDGRYFMMHVDVDLTPGRPPRLGLPRPLFEYDLRRLAFLCRPARCYDVAPDGESFYVGETATPSLPAPVTHVNYIPNWFEELKAKVPVRR
jgi:serine/threonine-protein kinase